MMIVAGSSTYTCRQNDHSAMSDDTYFLVNENALLKQFLCAFHEHQPTISFFMSIHTKDLEKGPQTAQELLIATDYTTHHEPWDANLPSSAQS